MPIPIYSRQLFSIRNFAGTQTLNNPGPDHYVIQTVTVFWGGLSAVSFNLVDTNGVTMLQTDLISTGPSSMVWTDLRISWAAGENIGLITSGGLDMTGHGYQLTPP